MVSYRQIRHDYQSHALVEDVLVDHYAKLISPLFTRLFVRAGITPNRVTVLMMVSGVIGATLFAIPQIACKVCGLAFIHLWYVLDCSDGETARITKQFSKFGTEIDYTAHVVNHPLFNLAFAYSLVGMGRYNLQAILFASILCISAELVLRNLECFWHVYGLKMTTPLSKKDQGGFLPSICIRIVGFFSIYPNFALIFPLVYFADLYFGTSLAMYYLFIQTLLSSLRAIRGSYKYVRTIIAAG